MMDMDAYTVLAPRYDELTGDVDYEKWAGYAQRHFQKLKRPVRLVAELGCGTGSLTKLLAERGYQMIATDLSPDMLAVADQKCQGLGVRFLCQDMARLYLPEEVDAIISGLDSVNYLTRPRLVKDMFGAAHFFLNPGGLFLFDVKTPAALEGADGQTYLDEDEDFYCVWRADYYRRRRICAYGLDLFVRREDGAWDRGSEYHEEFAYTMDELEGFLREAGFQNIKQYGDKTMRPPKEGAKRVFFAAKKE